MPERVPERALDRLLRLVNGRPTASEFESLGGYFNPQFHFMALLPSATLPAGETTRVQNYFDTVLETLAPVRDLIAAYWLSGVMSRTPISDFSLEVQFGDPKVVELLRKSLPRELSSSVVTNQPPYESTLGTQADASMRSPDKNCLENRDPMNGDVSQSRDVGTLPESDSQEYALRVVAIPKRAPVAVLPQPVYTPPIASPMQSLEPKRRNMLIADGIVMRGGNIYGCDHLEIEGEAYSTIDRCEKLEILENGIFKGSASVGQAEISGYCTGTLVVRDKLRVTRTGHVAGSIQYGRLQVEDGGRLEGEMKLPVKASETGPKTQPENHGWIQPNAKVSSPSAA